ncbi:NAD(P)/FAD-dependent oxidoreductase [Alkalilacustris brevis]|uniref:NAD(P)/FAD-dependent oxidoreductase n=1 Tax=Alkalilacustris brevis TaxID=2026338 RepID=UPI000E0D4473|nr:FAD-binding oxidoreductase [Alkalilacustris brevis]
MQRLYEAQAYDTGQWPDSHWARTAPPLLPCPPLTGHEKAEVAIIGAGYAGLNAALELAERFDTRAMVLDAGQPGWGASGRNGGFACAGGTKLNDAAIARRCGADGLAAFHDFQNAAIARVADNLHRYGIDADRGPEGELLLAHSARAWARMQREAPAAQLRDRDALRREGLFAPGFHGGVLQPQGFPLHPLKYARGLAQAALNAGVRICGDSPVTGLARAGHGWRLTTPQGQLDARRVLVATNGYSADDLPPWLRGRYMPALSCIMVTRPLSTQEQAAQGWTGQVMAYDSRHLLHYFRLLPCGRFLFGMRGGLSADPVRLRVLEAEARRHFERLFPAWAHVETESRWSGLVCLTGSLAPFCAEVPGAPGLFAALGWHGNGVAPASEGGRRIAAAMAGQPNPAPALMQMVPRRFPLPRLRRLWLRLAYAGLALRDGPVRAAPAPAQGGRKA